MNKSTTTPVWSSRTLWGAVASLLAFLPEIVAEIAKQPELLPEQWRPWLKLIGAALAAYAVAEARRAAGEAARNVERKIEDAATPQGEQ